MKRYRHLRPPTIAALCLSFLFSLCQVAQGIEVPYNDQGKGALYVEDGYFLGGYDPVAYFESSAPAKGDEKISLDYLGAVVLFVSQNNRSKFRDDPLKYLPAYGGWCAYAMGANAKKVRIDPETYKVTDGRLYLFYNFFFSNTLESWNKNEEELIKLADENWKEFE